MLFARKKTPASLPEMSDTLAPPLPVLEDDSLEGTQAEAAGESGLFLSEEPQPKADKPKRRWFGRARKGASQGAKPATEGAPSAKDGLPAPEEADGEPKRGRFGWRLRKQGERSDRAKPRAVELPIRILMGYLPAVSARDAAEFALGVAEKNFDQPSISFFDAFAHEDGYVYEVHEGGPGRAYAPNLLKHLASASFMQDNPTAVLATATRSVQVELTRGGLQCVLLPESAEAQPTEGLMPSAKMRPVITKRTGLLISGAGIFVTGFFGLLLALLARMPTYEAPPVAPVERVSYEQLPMAQWNRVSSVPHDRYVKALRFEKNAWRIEDAPIGAPEEPPAPTTPPAVDIDPTANPETQP